MLLVLAMAAGVFPMSAFAAKPADSGIMPYYEDDNYFYIIIALNEYKVPKGTVLSYGSKGQYVNTAQMKLNEVSMKTNANCSVGTVDGDFGVNTQNGTYAFQRWFNEHRQDYGVSMIDVDGIIGSQTWRAFSILFFVYS